MRRGFTTGGNTEMSLSCLSLGVFHVLWNLGVTINGVAVSTVQQAVMPIIITP